MCNPWQMVIECNLQGCIKLLLIWKHLPLRSQRKWELSRLPLRFRYLSQCHSPISIRLSRNNIPQSVAIYNSTYPWMSECQIGGHYCIPRCSHVGLCVRPSWSTWCSHLRPARTASYQPSILCVSRPLQQQKTTTSSLCYLTGRPIRTLFLSGNNDWKGLIKRDWSFIIGPVQGSWKNDTMKVCVCVLCPKVFHNWWWVGDMKNWHKFYVFK